MSSGVLHGGRTGPSLIGAIGASGALLAVLVVVAAGLLRPSAWFPFKVAGAYLIAVALIASFASLHVPRREFGPANTVTLLRAALTALLFGVVLEAATPQVLWFCVVVATLALILDGVDGWVARRRHATTGFGARFDMETDAALMLVLALLVWLLDRAGAWVLLAGVLRYAFVGAGLLTARLRGPLPPSVRRKTACIVQLVALVVALGPIIPPALASAAAATGLAFLVYSFALDTAWLVKHA